MRTAMQELLNSLCHQSNGCQGKERYVLSGVIDYIKSELIEKEKQQIIDAWDAGYDGCDNDIIYGQNGPDENYYDKTFGLKD